MHALTSKTSLCEPRWLQLRLLDAAAQIVTAGHP